MKTYYKLLLAALFIATILSPLASPNPDGLERVATDLGFAELGEGKQLIESPAPGYLFLGIGNEYLATAAAGAAGTLVCLAAVLGLGRLIKKKGSVPS